MWFAKLFGAGRDKGSDDEPARFPSMPVAPRPQGASALKAAPQAKAPKQVAKKGFDPYNSGAFQQRNAWERVSRR